MASFYLRSSGSGSNDSLIYVFLSVKGKWIRVSTTLKINPKYWNEEKQRSRENREFEGYKDLNRRLKAIDEDIEGIKEASKNGNLTYGQIKELVIEYIDREYRPEKLLLSEPEPEPTKPEIATLYSFIANFIEKSKLTKKPSTIQTYKIALFHLKGFETATGYKIDFDNISIDFYDKFLSYLIHEKNHKNNSAGKQIKTIKTFLRDATEQGINKNLDFTKKKFKVLKEEADTIYLTESELTAIYELSLNNGLAQVRDLFIIGCYTGLRFSDLSRLNIDNIKDGIINIRTTKTDSAVSIPLHYRVKEILHKYNGNLPKGISNQKTNDYLKTIAQKAGIEETVSKRQTQGATVIHNQQPKYELVTTHTARRSFATNAFLGNVPTIQIMKITGHKTEKSFMKYIRISGQDSATKLQLHPFFSGEVSQLRAVV